MSENDRTFANSVGVDHLVFGTFCTLSFDDGDSWSYRRMESDRGPERVIETPDGTPCAMGPDMAETRGYLAACQAEDEQDCPISSTNHYSFDLPWLATGR